MQFNGKTIQVRDKTMKKKIEASRVYEVLMFAIVTFFIIGAVCGWLFTYPFGEHYHNLNPNTMHGAEVISDFDFRIGFRCNCSDSYWTYFFMNGIPYRVHFYSILPTCYTIQEWS